jgi:O-antigen/teichoic acid export membrane protein
LSREPSDRLHKHSRHLNAKIFPADLVRFLLPKAKKLAGFFFGQGSVQALNLLTGFLLLRWLGVEQYAIYTLLAGFQGTMGVMVEMGLAGSLVGLLAGRKDNLTVGGYIESAKRYRNIFFAVAVPFTAVAFTLLFLRQGWGWDLGAVLFVALLTNTFFLSWTKYYSVPFLIRHDMTGLYLLQAVFAALRLAGCWLLSLGGVISAAVVAWLTAITTTAMGWAYRRQASPLIEQPDRPDPEKNREILNFIRPLMPATLFYAFQGQIGVLLISWFGKADTIAEVGALSRISQIFILFGAFNTVVVAPYIAKTPRHLLLRRYFGFFSGALGLSACVVSAGFFLPGIFIWLIGPNYSHLAADLGFLLLASCLNLVSGLMWCMHSARKWIFGWGVWLYIATTILVQLVCLKFMALDTVKGILMFSIYTSLAMFSVCVVWAFAGFRKDRSA